MLRPTDDCDRSAGMHLCRRHYGCIGRRAALRLGLGAAACAVAPVPALAVVTVAGVIGDRREARRVAKLRGGGLGAAARFLRLVDQL